MFNYKKIILLAIGLIIVLVGCNKVSEANFYSKSNQSIKEGVLDLDSIGGSIAFEGDIIQNEEIANQYADIIIKETLKKNINDYKTTKVNYDSNKKIWIISYYVDDETIGGDINIAISKKDGEVYKVWFGE